MRIINAYSLDFLSFLNLFLQVSEKQHMRINIWSTISVEREFYYLHPGVKVQKWLILTVFRHFQKLMAFFTDDVEISWLYYWVGQGLTKKLLVKRSGKVAVPNIGQLPKWKIDAAVFIRPEAVWKLWKLHKALSAKSKFRIYKCK